MRFSLPTVVVLCTFVPTILSRVTPKPIRKEHKDYNNAGLPNTSLNPRQTYQNCTDANTRIRREWWARAILNNFRFGREGWHRVRRALSKGEQSGYIDAVLCLLKKPSIYKEVTGAKSRFDDFQIEHITQAYDIHFNVSVSSDSNIFWKPSLRASRLYSPPGIVGLCGNTNHYWFRNVVMEARNREFSLVSNLWKDYWIDCLGTGTGPSTVQTSRLPPCSMAHLTALEVMAIKSI